jgi:cytochrome c oxidase subunit 2
MCTIRASAWQWYPILQLEKGRRISPAYLFHGFAARVFSSAGQHQPSGYALDMTMWQPLRPSSSGEFTIVCNEYCFVGHHTMVGKVIVK